MSGKKFLTPEAGEKIITQTKLPIPPSPQKSNGQPLRGWRKKRIWLGRVHYVVMMMMIPLLKCQNCNSGV